MEFGMEKSVSLLDLYRELKKIEQNMVTKAQLDMVVETISVLSNPDTMRQIEESEEDIKMGRFKIVNSAKEI